DQRKKNSRSSVVQSGSISKHVEQVLHRPVAALLAEAICRRAVLPDAVANGAAGFALQGGLGQEAAEVTGKHVPAAPLGEVRVAGRVHKDLSGGATDDSLVAFQHHP